MSSPEVVAEIVRNLMAVGVPAKQIWIYERFPDQMATVRYDSYVPAGVNVDGIEKSRGSIARLRSATYVEVDFFGEDDTRSMLVRLVIGALHQDHQRAEHEGSRGGGRHRLPEEHRLRQLLERGALAPESPKTNTLSFHRHAGNGRAAAFQAPCCRSWTACAASGMADRFVHEPRFRFYPKQMMFGTDPVAIDRLLLDVIEEKRKQEHAISVWDRSSETVHRGFEHDPNANNFVREPGHIEFAGGLGLGIYDLHKINEKSITV